MKSEYTLNEVSIGPLAWISDWMAAVDLAVTTDPVLHLYFFHVPLPVQVVGHLATVPFPEVYGMQASVTIPVLVK